MFLRRLYLHNFRCYPEAVFEFNPGINAIHGANAQGKTSILEAIYVLITGNSFRATQLAELIRFGTEGFYIEADFIKHGIEQKLRMSCSGKERKIIYNNTPCASSAGLLGILQGVVMTPDDVALVKGSPVIRRQFLDLQIAQADPLYVHHLTRYHRAMRQRNVLLKAKKNASLDGWEQEMANSAAYLSRQRLQAVHDLQECGKQLHAELNGAHEHLELMYKSSAPAHDTHEVVKNYYTATFQKLRPKESILGFTLAGPHKDDITISLSQKEARFFASEGQQRSCVASLHLAEWARLNSVADEPPLMLIDDIGISLDNTRRRRLLDHVSSLGQVFLTSTDDLQFPQAKQAAKSIYINA